MGDILKTHIQNLKQFNKHRLLWLKLSGFVFVTILSIIIDRAFFGKNNLYWYLTSLGLTVSVVWWYWTMRLIRQILAHRTLESALLLSILDDVQQLKEDIKILDNSH
jgi:hypothetical protein